MNKKNIRDLTYARLEKYFTDRQILNYRFKQVWSWLYISPVFKWGNMKNIPLTLVKQLQDDFNICSIKPVNIQKSQDTTLKILFQLRGHNQDTIESVVIPSKHRTTICVSTQVGCKMGCKFCASGLNGWNKNLSVAEIMEQVLYVQGYIKNHDLYPLTHIVFMGIGEPLDNYIQLLQSIRIMTHPLGMNISQRRITVSTSGLVPKIKQLADEKDISVRLAISLHGYNNYSRDKIMPINKVYPIQEVIEASKYYTEKIKRQVSFEYILIKGITCNPKAAQKLYRLLGSLKTHVNLIPYNPIREFRYETPEKDDIYRFHHQLQQLGLSATVRISRGKDINGACGQLRKYFMR